MSASAGVNVLATLERRPEVYHGAIAAAATAATDAYDGPPSILKKVVLKQEGLDQLLVYDRSPRKALVDHVYPLDVTIDDLIACRDVDRGDFATGTYMARVHRDDGRVSVVMDRPGWADGHAIRVRKTLTLAAGASAIDVDYLLEDLPEGKTIHFAVEINLAAMAGHAHDRYYSDPSGRRLGMLDARLDLADVGGIGLTDEWLDLDVGLAWSVPGGLWCFPIETVSQSESGFEGVYQSSAVIPHWVIKAGAERRWGVQIRWTLDTPRVGAVASVASVSNRDQTFFSQGAAP